VFIVYYNKASFKQKEQHLTILGNHTTSTSDKMNRKQKRKIIVVSLFDNDI